MGKPGPGTGPVQDLVQPGCRQWQSASWALEHHKHMVGVGAGGTLSIKVGADRGEEPCRDRDQPLVAAMVLGGLRRCEVLGLRLGDLHVAERRVFIAEGKGGHQRLIPISARFFTAISAYLEAERPAGTATDHVFVVLKGPRRGLPLSAARVGGP